jgi:drug/metabolite transporter (DMT)-like permease
MRPRYLIPPRWAPAGLLLAASLWGLLWLPMRYLAHRGIPGEISVLVMYSLVILAFAVCRPRTFREWWAAPATLLPIGLFAGWSNVGFILGVITAEIMRVTLLFYLSPLWSVLLARLVLAERLTRRGYACLAMALAGLLLVLSRPGSGWPLPQSAGDWLGLSAGLSFAMGNVLARRARRQSIPARALTVAIGMVLVSAVTCLVRRHGVLPGSMAWATSGALFPLLALLGLLASLGIQFGLQYTPATRAAVILLFELVVAAISSTLLAGERLHWQECLGGLMIVTAGLASSRLVASPARAAGPERGRADPESV